VLLGVKPERRLRVIYSSSSENQCCCVCFANDCGFFPVSHMDLYAKTYLYK